MVETQPTETQPAKTQPAETQPRLIDSPARIVPRRDRMGRPRRRHRRHGSRRLRRLRRLWPLLAVLVLMLIIIIAVTVSASRRLSRVEDPTKIAFGISLINRAEIPARRVDVQMWWPDGNLEAKYSIADLAPGNVDFQQFWAPPGFRFKIKVLMQDGTEGGGQRTLSAGTIGGLRIIIHDKGMLSLE